jgi:hypothetical protein
MKPAGPFRRGPAGFSLHDGINRDDSMAAESTTLEFLNLIQRP